jgi:low affinity Fe/Cu permease
VNNGSNPRNHQRPRKVTSRPAEDSANSQPTPQETAHFLEARRQVARTNTVNLWFSRMASRTAQLVGHPYMFLGAVLILVLWAVSGPFFHFSDTWQLIINTGTTIITFLVVFLIQNTQNRDAKALHLKLDELIRSHSPARNDMIDIEKLSDEELDELEKRYAAICEENKARKAKRQPAAKADEKEPAA